MSKFLSEVKGFTPVIDVLANELGLMTAVVYGVVWRYCQMEGRVCTASRERIASHVGISTKTVERHLQKLCEAGYLKDLTPHQRSKPHIYKDAGKAKIRGLLAVEIGETESPEGKTESLTKLDTKSNQGKTESLIRKPSQDSLHDRKETTTCAENDNDILLETNIPRMPLSAQEIRAYLQVSRQSGSALSDAGLERGSEGKVEVATKEGGGLLADAGRRPPKGGDGDEQTNVSRNCSDIQTSESDFGHSVDSDNSENVEGNSQDGKGDREPSQEFVRYGRAVIAVKPDDTATVVERAPPPWEKKRIKPKTRWGVELLDLCPDWQGFKSPKQRANFQTLERNLDPDRFEDIVNCAVRKWQRGELVGDIADAVINIATAHPEKPPFETQERDRAEQHDAARHPLHDDPRYQPFLTPTAVSVLQEGGYKVSEVQGGGFLVEPGRNSPV